MEKRKKETKICGLEREREEEVGVGQREDRETVKRDEK